MGVESNQWAVERCGGAALTAWEVREVVKYDIGWFTSCGHADGGLCQSIRRSPVFDLWEWAMKHDFQLVISEATAFRRMSGRHRCKHIYKGSAWSVRALVENCVTC